MELVQGSNFVKKDGSRHTFQDALENAEIIGFYFSAHWCPPCRMFTPVLADMYTQLKDDDLPFEVVFVSSDQTEHDMINYMNETHGDWFALEFNSAAISDLKSKYNIAGIPSLVIVKKDGTLVTKEGRNDVQGKGPAAFKQWTG